MVEVSSLKELDIYTVTGHYVGRVADVILNIRLGTISKLQVRAIEPEKKQVGFRDLMKRSFQVAPEEEHDVRSFKNDLLTIDFDKVQAIGDIMLINPRDMKKVRHDHQCLKLFLLINKLRFQNKVSLKHKQNLKNSKVNFSSFFIYFLFFLYF